MLFANEPHQIFLVRFHQFAITREDACTPKRRRIAPARQRRLGGRHSQLHIRLVRERYLSNGCTGGRIKDRCEALAAAGCVPPVDPEGESLRCHADSAKLDLVA